MFLAKDNTGQSSEQDKHNLQATNPAFIHPSSPTASSVDYDDVNATTSKEVTYSSETISMASLENEQVENPNDNTPEPDDISSMSLEKEEISEFTRHLSDTSEHDDTITNYFIRPQEYERDSFFRFHPQQDPDIFVFKTKDGVSRKWLTLDKKKDALFCSMCIVFGKKTSNFSTCGITDKNHWANRVQEHEKSQGHLNSIRDYLAWTHDYLIEQGFQKQLKIAKDHILEKRAFLSRVIDVIKIIGKLGLPYRGSNNESAYSLADSTKKHGVFLELVLLLSKYDTITENHVKECIKKSSDALLKSKQGSKKRGRGNLVTLMSKSTVNLILGIIKDIIQTTIATQVIKAKLFSIQIDSTQDVSTKDQLSIVIRYINDNNLIKERLFSMIDGQSSKGSYYVEVLKNCLEKHGIDINGCISNSTDGAANMQGVYNGFSTLLKNELKTHIHTWCYAHVLNLVMNDVTTHIIEVNLFFSLLNNLANFFKKSYKKMNMWKKENRVSSNVLKRLQSVGETRWWSKDKALTTIFGSLDDQNNSLYLKVLLCLLAIRHDNTMKSDQISDASTYFESLIKYETIVTAHVFLKLFSITSRLSKYLQTSGLDLLTAKRMIKDASFSLKTIQRDFESVQVSAEKFVSLINDKISKLDLPIDEKKQLKISTIFEEKRLRPNPIGWYKINVYNNVMDTAVSSFDNRFTEETTALLVDLSFLHPRNFPKISKNGLPENAMQSLAVALNQFDDTITASILRKEIVDLANLWDIIKLSPLEEYELTPEYQSSDEESDDEPCIPHTEKDDYCKNCPLCVFLLLNEYNMLTNSFRYAGSTYRFLLTLSVTQVACERSFSSLKIVKSRIRSSLTQVHLEAFMLMMCEHDLVVAIDNESIIDKVACHSKAYARILQH